VEQPLDLGPHLVQGCAQVLEHVSRDALAFDQETEEQVLRSHVVVTHPACLFEGDLDHLLDTRGRDDLLDDDPLISTEHGLDRLADLADLHSKVVQNLGRETFAFPEQS
jgi:hypothetical protein